MIGLDGFLGGNNRQLICRGQDLESILNRRQGATLRAADSIKDRSGSTM